MDTLHISVPDPMRDWVQSQIEGGKYASADDYVRDLIQRDQIMAAERPQWMVNLDAVIAEGLADEAAGRMVDAEEMFDRLDAKYAAMIR
jgi:antitoxin ParD1/3/4